MFEMFKMFKEPSEEEVHSIMNADVLADELGLNGQNKDLVTLKLISALINKGIIKKEELI
jgi:hypothetical protein